MTALLADNPAARQAYEEWKYFNSDERMHSVEQANEFFIHDVYTAQHIAREKGLEEGLSVGRVEGITIGKIEIARSTLQMKIEDIVRLTGLSREEIERLQ
ncbi:MAG: hypothetical protein LBT46_12290 [Planctomycetaceae bacterium]|nr:hypothetical protein [Planctomycetaceae bacterium]